MSKFTPILNLDSISPVTAKGDLMVRNASMIQKVGIGADNTVLTADSTQGSGTKWAAVSSNVVTASLAGATVLPATSTYLYVSGTTFTITFPAPVNGLQYFIQKVDGFTTTQSIGATNGVAGFTLSTINEMYSFTCDGSTYWPTNHYAQTAWATFSPTYVGASVIGASQSAFWRRNGSNFEMRGHFTVAAANGSTGAVTIPFGQINSNAIIGAAPNNYHLVGMAVNSRTSTAQEVVLAGGGMTTIAFSIAGGAANANQPQLGNVIWAANDNIFYFCVIPILGLGA